MQTILLLLGTFIIVLIVSVGTIVLLVPLIFKKDKRKITVIVSDSGDEIEPITKTI